MVLSQSLHNTQCHSFPLFFRPNISFPFPYKQGFIFTRRTGQFFFIVIIPRVRPPSRFKFLRGDCGSARYGPRGSLDAADADARRRLELPDDIAFPSLGTDSAVNPAADQSTVFNHPSPITIGRCPIPQRRRRGLADRLGSGLQSCWRNDNASPYIQENPIPFSSCVTYILVH